MDALMLEGWTPILLIGIVAAIIIFLFSRKISRKSLFLISVVLSLVCVGLLVYSRKVVGGWEGIGLAFVTFSSLMGIWLGTISGILIRK